MAEFDTDVEDRKCAPSKKFEQGSCFTYESLVRMCTAYNNKGRDPKPIQIQGRTKQQLVTDLTNKLKKVCTNQICWLSQDFIREIRDAEIHENTFRPKITQKKTAWLSTTNITEVMEQYQSLYPKYKYLGTVPVDFEKINANNIGRISFDSLVRQGKTQIGMVINLDRHDQSGSHWVSLFADLEKCKVYFFDSFAERPPKEVRDFVAKIGNWCFNKVSNIPNPNPEDSFMKPTKKNKVEQHPKLDIQYNKIQHQFKNSECGVYSANFLIRLAKGETFKSITENITRDDEMNQCRKVYFRFK